MYAKNDNFKWKPSFQAMIVGSSKAGKSIFTKNFINQWEHCTTGRPISRLTLFYSVWQDNYSDMLRALPADVLFESHAGLPNTNDDLPTADESTVNEFMGHQCRTATRLGPSTGDGCHVVIFDDLVLGQKQNSFLTSVFSVLSHHFDISVFVITQILFANTDLNRSLLRNCDQVVVCRSAVASSTLRGLQQLYFTNQPKYLADAYAKITAKGGDYVNVNLTPQCLDSQRVRCGVLRSEVFHAHHLRTFL